MSKDSSQKQVVWITGASSGIGAALAKEYVCKGYRLVLSSRRLSDLEAVASSLKIPSSDYLLLPFDLNNQNPYNLYLDQILKHFSQLDIVFLNGGMSQRSEALKTTPEIEKELMQVNYFSQVAMAKAVLPYMISQQKGQLVVVSSIAGKFGFYLRSSYAAAKHALFGYFESLRLETDSTGISIHLVFPGKIKTRVSQNAITSDGSKHQQMDPSHVSAMNAEDCARYISNQIEKGRLDFFVGGKEGRILWIQRYFPSLFKRILRKQSPY